MKYAAVFAIVGMLAPVSMAQSVVAPAVVSVESKVESAINELCDLQVKIVELLESAKDKETADAAAEELYMIIGRVQELQPDVQQIRSCDAATQQKLIKKLLQATLAVDARKKAVGKSLVEHQFYGSEDLKDAMRAMM